MPPENAVHNNHQRTNPNRSGSDVAITASMRPRERRTHILIWCAAVICAVLSFCVIIAGMVTIIGYIVIHPRVPYITVVSASLPVYNFDYAGVLEVQANIDMRAHNGNKKAHATFSNWIFNISLGSQELMSLQVPKPFDVSKNSSVDFHFEAQSKPIPLDPELEATVDSSLKQDSVTFNLKGSARARWGVGHLGSAQFVCSLDCKLKFHTLEKTFIPSRCSSKAK